MEWVDSADEAMLYLSVLTLGEIRKGLGALPLSTRRTRLEAWLEADLPTRFAGRIVAVDAAIADRWGSIAADARRTGKTMPVIDGLLAATALHHNYDGRFAQRRRLSTFARSCIEPLASVMRSLGRSPWHRLHSDSVATHLLIMVDLRVPHPYYGPKRSYIDDSPVLSLLSG
jgi:predicted nucleic acid-binding protein